MPELSPERRYAEDAAIVMEGMGLPRAYGKLFAWLMICEPRAQSVTEIAHALAMSKSTVSTGTRLLERGALIRKVAAPGRRGTFYEMDGDAIVRIVEGGARWRVFSDLLDRALGLIGDDPDRAGRLRRTRDFYAFMEREMADLIARFNREYPPNTEGKGDG